MKKLIIKMDRYILDRLTDYIKIWIKRHDYKKHKVDFGIRLQYIGLGLLYVFCVGIPVVIYLIEGKVFLAVSQAFIWILASTLQYFFIVLTTKEMKPFYDELFANRKNPMWYEMHKQVLEERFIRKRRERIVMNGFAVLIAGSVCGALTLLSYATDNDVNKFIMIFILFDFPIQVIQRYLLYVFDFDEPEPKKKVAKESLTEVMARAWQEFIGGLQPNWGT